MQTSRSAAVDLYWIPLGAGGHSVRFNGRVFEAIEAARRHRPRCDLYHAALVVELSGDRYTIEIAPSPDADGASRGVVATGAVGSRFAGRLRLFRYEVRCWRGGSIPDLGAAVGGRHRISSDPRVAGRFLDVITTVPRPVWGRDELMAGEMWNSNSVIAWLIATAGLPTDELRPPPRGRAPGWRAGLEVAGRSRSMAALKSRADLVDAGGDGGHGPIAAVEADVPVATRAPDRRSLNAPLVRESGWPMSTALLSLAAHPLHAAVAFAHFGAPDGYVGPHDSPAAFARAVEAARTIARP
jgi:hypothetical protein